MVKTLKETTEMMVSPDYNERFKAEYYQLMLRFRGLQSILFKWDNGSLSFEHAQEAFIIFRLMLWQIIQLFQKLGLLWKVLNYKGEGMNPVFVFLVLVGAVVLWFLLSALFYPFGRFLHRIWKDAVDEINREENKEKDKENE